MKMLFLTMSSKIYSNEYIAEVDEEVRELFDTGGFAEVHNLEELKKVLPPTDTLKQRMDLYAFIKYGETNTHTMWVKDRIIVKLQEMSPWPPEFIDALGSIALDKETDGQMRGYAVQHLRFAFSDASEVERSEIREVLLQGLTDYESDVSGTSILALVNLAEKHPLDFDLAEIQQGALDLALNDQLTLTSRITSVQVCGKLKLDESRIIAKRLATGANNTVLRLAAISTLGEIGTAEDVEALKDIIENEDKIYHKAVEKALNKINSNTGEKSE